MIYGTLLTPRMVGVKGRGSVTHNPRSNRPTNKGKKIIPSNFHIPNEVQLY